MPKKEYAAVNSPPKAKVSAKNAMTVMRYCLALPLLTATTASSAPPKNLTRYAAQTGKSMSGKTIACTPPSDAAASRLQTRTLPRAHLMARKSRSPSSRLFSKNTAST